MKVIKTVAHLMYNTCRGLNRIAKYHQYVEVNRDTTS